MLVTLIGFVLLVISLVKLYLKFTSSICTNNVSMLSKTVLITGADKGILFNHFLVLKLNSLILFLGIGYETTFDLARRGARVIMACRDVENAKRVAANIKLFKLS